MQEKTLVELDSSASDVIEPIVVNDVAAVVNEIRSAEQSNLLDRTWLATWLLPRLGLNDEFRHEFPDALQRFCGKGVRSWQFPCQFSGYLAHLGGQDITSYLEIGVRHAGTFIITCEYLKRFMHLERMVAIDPLQSPNLAAYQAVEPRVEHVAALSHSFAGRAAIGSRLWGHVLIDGDHSASGCMTDFLLVKDRAKQVAFHDIVSYTNPGVVEVWNAIRRVTPARRIFEQTQQYAEIFAKTGKTLMGLGVVELV